MDRFFSICTPFAGSGLFNFGLCYASDLAAAMDPAFVTNCHLTHLLCTNRLGELPWEFETVHVSNGFGVVLGRSYFWRQAQVCMSLARATDDPMHKQRYQDLALELILKANDERGLNTIGPPLAANKPKPDGGNASSIK